MQRGGSARIVFHAFSMVGWSLYSLLLQDLAAARSSPAMADVCGAVLDSAPETAVRGGSSRCLRQSLAPLCLSPSPMLSVHTHPPQCLPRYLEQLQAGQEPPVQGRCLLLRLAVPKHRMPPAEHGPQ